MSIDDILALTILMEDENKGVCSSCHREFIISNEFSSAKELNEFRLSGLCKNCQDQLFNPMRRG